MTSTITQTQQLQLVNIISISQVKLSNNFTILSKRLSRHDHRFQNISSQIQSNHSTVLTRISQVQQNIHQQLKNMKLQFQDIFSQLHMLKQTKTKHQQRFKKSEDNHIKLNQQLFNTQLQFQQKISIQINQLNEFTQTIKNMQQQLEKINIDLSNKENKLQVERISKEIEQIKEKNVHFQNQIKLNQHKIQKIQIYNQKNQRLQAKKDIDTIKEIEEKIKKQVKISLKNANLPPGIITSQSQLNKNPAMLGLGSGSNPNAKINLGASNTADKQNQGHEANQQQKRSSVKKRLPMNLQQEQILTQMMKTNSDTPINKIVQRINKLENQQKDITEIIKSNKFKKEDKNGDGANIKDKINQLKPEVIKLWAKFDTLQDRLAFNQKKMEQKSKILNDLVTLQKQNNWQKMQEKVKNLQTQIYTNIKDIRTKLDTKVNLPDYQKFVQNNDDKIRQINELIYLKSDKLEVKKALLFLESKIKQIILVISEDQENEKDALLTKKPLKCISCDKQVDKFTGNVSAQKGNWDGMPYKQHAPQTLGRFGMTNFGSLSKKLKKLEGKDLPILNKKNKNSFNDSVGPNSP